MENFTLKLQTEEKKPLYEQLYRALIGEIEAWRERYGAAEASPYQSENVAGVYSYTRAAGRNTEDGDAGWMAAFKGRLRRWRRLA